MAYIICFPQGMLLSFIMTDCFYAFYIVPLHKFSKENELSLC